MKGYARCGRLEGICINAMNNGHHSPRIPGVLNGEVLGAQKENDARFRSALGHLGIQHFVDLPQAWV
jgi:hypothetical protein